MEKVPSCPICSGKNFTHFLECTDFTTSREQFSLQQCVTCNLVITSPRPDQSEIEKYYKSESYISHTGGKKNLTDIIYVLARKATIRSKRRILEKYTNRKTILDFGCGTGELLNHLASHGYKTLGIEPSDVARKKAIAFGTSTILSNISELSKHKVDLITLWHVLEHLHELDTTLATLHSTLNKSGTVFIAVPNLKSFDSQHYKAHWAAYDVPRHLWHFSQSNMTTLLTKNNFKLIATLPMKLDAFYVSLLSESYANPKKGRIFNLINSFITGLKSNIKARKSREFSSLIYVAQKCEN